MSDIQLTVSCACGGSIQIVAPEQTAKSLFDTWWLAHFDCSDDCCDSHEDADDEGDADPTVIVPDDPSELVDLSTP